MASAAPQTPEYGILLPDGSRVVHGTGVNVRPAFPPELDIPGTLHLFSVGHAADPDATPAFRGAMGYFPFDRSMRMPRHVHMSPAGRFVTEKVLTVSGIALVELAGEVYVVPPLTMVVIAPGVPHTWTPCPPGLNLSELGITDGGTESAVEKAKKGDLVADGTFAAVFEYDDATTFYPTANTRRLREIEEYIACGDLHSIRFPEMGLKEVFERAWFIWGTSVRKLGSHAHVQ